MVDKLYYRANLHSSFRPITNFHSGDTNTKYQEHTAPLQKRAHYGPPPTTHYGLNFLLRFSVYLNMSPCVAALENAAQMAGL